MVEPKTIASATAENTGEIYKTALSSGIHTMIADEPVTAGGTDTGATPGDYLCMALASCQAITLRMYAQRKELFVKSIKIKVELVKGTSLSSGNNTFNCYIDLKGDLTEEQKDRMKEIAKACPVSKLFTKPSDIISIWSK